MYKNNRTIKKKKHSVFGLINIKNDDHKTIISFEHIYNLKEIINNDKKTECCICYENSTDKTLCNHPVCKDCIKKSLKNYKNFTCPLCRKEYTLKKYVVIMNK